MFRNIIFVRYYMVNNKMEYGELGFDDLIYI
jgi:hypothetical protein